MEFPNHDMSVVSGLSASVVSVSFFSGDTSVAAIASTGDSIESVSIMEIPDVGDSVEIILIAGASTGIISVFSITVIPVLTTSTGDFPLSGRMESTGTGAPLTMNDTSSELCEGTVVAI